MVINTYLTSDGEYLAAKDLSPAEAARLYESGELLARDAQSLSDDALREVCARFDGFRVVANGGAIGGVSVAGDEHV